MNIDKRELKKIRDKIYERANENLLPIPAQWFISCPLGMLADSIKWRLGENAGFALYQWLDNLNSDSYSEKEAVYLLKIANEYLEKTEKQEA